MTEIKLPPLPHLPLNDPAAAYKAVHDYGQQCATAAIEPYAKRIAELEADRQAVRREVLEEAAALVSRYAAGGNPGTDRPRWARDIDDAILALISKETT